MDIVQTVTASVLDTPAKLVWPPKGQQESTNSMLRWSMLNKLILQLMACCKDALVYPHDAVCRMPTSKLRSSNVTLYDHHRADEPDWPIHLLFLSTLNSIEYSAQYSAAVF